MFKYCIFHQKRDFRVRSHVSAKQKIQGKSNEVIPESLCVKTKFPLNVLSEQKYKVRASNDLISKSLGFGEHFWRTSTYSNYSADVSQLAGVLSPVNHKGLYPG